MNCMKKKLKNKCKFICIVVIILIAFVFLCFFEEADAVEEKSKNNITIISKVLYTTNPISNTYTYKIEPHFANMQGVLNEPTSFEINFNNTVPNENNIAIESFDINFSNVQYSIPGTYKYYITEVNSSNELLFPISNKKYEITVSVTEKDNNVFIEVLNQFFDIEAGTKTDKLDFEHKANTTYIVIENDVIGKLADKNEYFKYKLSIKGNPGNVFKIWGQDDIILYNGQKRKTKNEYTVKSGNENYIYIYLKHGQKVFIGLSSEGEDAVSQILVGTNYKVIQLDARSYKTYINEIQNKSTSYLEAKQNPEDNKINVINEKE